MVQSLKYFLSVSALLILGCSPKNGLQELTPTEKETLTGRIEKEINSGYYFQGSLVLEAKLDTLLQLNYKTAECLREIAVPYTKSGDYHIAFPLLEKSVPADSSESLYYYGWVLLYYFRDYERALERLNQYDNLTPGRADFPWGEHVNILKGLALKQMGKDSLAVLEFTTAIEDQKENVEVYAFVHRGVACLNLGLYTQANRDFDTAIARYESCTDAYFWKAESEIRMGNIPNAIKLLQKALTLADAGYLRTDPYVHLFDAVSGLQIKDKLNTISQ